ncbi:protein-export chaperone SecB [Marinitoga lauensis]|uniref:protein-export chaperone SecB n=1 Tax=Marinitoga lauensis TaxID=2201189 RepID=UPI001010E435|nr:protein-export chaperone SecB [Marinitoga lauensis]
MKKSYIQLISERIKKFSFEFDDSVINEPLSPELKIEAFQNFKEKIDDNPYNCILGLNIKLIYKKGRKHLLKVEMFIEGEFTGHSKMKEEDFRSLVVSSGIINLFQIARAKMVSITSQFGFVQPIYLPLLNITDLIEAERKKALKNIIK